MTDWAGWYGPSGRYVKTYDINKVESSLVHKALIKIGRHLPPVQEIESLRTQATIMCGAAAKQGNSSCQVRNGCLFDITLDPCEKNDVSKKHPEIVLKMKKIINELQKTAMPPSNGVRDPLANPKY